MPRYTLKCQHGHEFTSWFQSSEAYAKLKASGLITCAICGSTSVEKAVMSPQLRLGRDKISAPSPAAQHSEGAAPQQPTPARAAKGARARQEPSHSEALRKLSQYIRNNSEYVGREFAHEARAIHQGAAPERAIHGEASPKEVKTLLKEGMPIVPLPFAPGRKPNSRKLKPRKLNSRKLN